MAIVCTVNAGGAQANSTTVAVVLTGVVAGSRIVVEVGSFGMASIGAVADNQNGAYTKDKEATDAGGSRSGIFSVANAYTGNLTITFTPPSSGYIWVSAAEYTGVHATYADNSSATDDGYSNSPNPGNCTPSVAALVVAVFATGSGDLSTTPSGYTVIRDNGTPPGGSAYKIQSGTGQENPTWTKTTTSYWNACLASYKPAAAGGGATNVVYMIFES